MEILVNDYTPCSAHLDGRNVVTVIGERDNVSAIVYQNGVFELVSSYRIEFLGEGE